jgi:hypothetical protein
VDLILSKSNSAIRTASSLSSAIETISPVGPACSKTEKISYAAAESFQEHEEMKGKKNQLKSV